MSVSDAVYESALARIDALERERDDCHFEANRMVAEVERLLAALAERDELIRIIGSTLRAAGVGDTEKPLLTGKHPRRPGEDTHALHD